MEQSIVKKTEKKEYNDIIVQELMGKIEKGNIVLVDVRRPIEYARGYIKGSILIPLADIETRYKEISDRVTCECKETIIYCRSGVRSVIASKLLINLGFKNVTNVLGGIIAWENAGGEVIKQE